VAIGWAQITFIILNRNNEMGYPLVKQYGYHPSFRLHYHYYAFEVLFEAVTSKNVKI
jgi:hypothetical protein